MQVNGQSDSDREASFSTLPPELQLRILSECDPLSLVRISATSHAALAIARADSLWRTISLDLITAHRFPDQYAGDRTTPATEVGTTSWYSLAAFLLHNAHHLGYFASSQPFTSRIIRVGIVGPAPAHVQPDAPPPRYTIRAAQLVPRNALANALAPPSPPQQLLPFGAIQHALEPGSWLVSPRANPAHPYAGYSVDFLEPTYSFDAEMFDILPEPELGACLPRGNSHTREAIAAAALGPAYEQNAGPTPATTTPRLRLALEPVSQAVAPSSPSTSRLDPDPTSQSETNPADPMERLALNREALFALFSGRLPRRPWPTAQLVGLDWINSAELPYLRAGRTDPPRYVFRQSASGGAFRGLEEWLTERKGGQRPLARIVEPDFAAAAANMNSARRAVDDRAYVTGFRLRAKRMSNSPVRGTTPRQGGGQGGGGERPAAAGQGQARASGRSDNPRRRGVGPNGGMAVLWQGRERNPDEDRPPPMTTILRAGDGGGGGGGGDDAPGGFVLRVPGSPPQAPPPTEPLQALHANNNNDRPSPELLADEVEVVDSAPPAEGFFPIKPPAEPLSWTNNQDRNRDHAAATDEHGHLLAHSLEGYWIGPYSSHGLEILNLTTGLAEFPASASASSSSDEDEDSSDSEDGRRVTYRRVITATKVTGDPNVPSGQTSWLAILPAAAMSTHLANLADGPVPSVEAEKFHLLSSLDPSSASYQSLNNGAGPDWTEGCVRAYGRIALTGYTSPSYSPAEIRFLRRETRLCDPDQLEEERAVETIEEIHVRWLEMHKVTVFKRMRI